MASEIKVDTIVNAGGDNDTGIDLATNDQILLKVANATRLTMNATGQTTIVGEGGTTTTSLQQGLNKAWTHFQGTSTAASVDGLNISSVDDDGTGDHGLHFTNNMANATYCVPIGVDDDNSSQSVIEVDTSNGTMATTGFDFEGYFLNSSTNRTNLDIANIYLVITGDLA